MENISFTHHTVRELGQQSTDQQHKALSRKNNVTQKDLPVWRKRYYSMIILINTERW